jgi:hypothetical protein
MAKKTLKKTITKAAGNARYRLAEIGRILSVDSEMYSILVNVQLKEMLETLSGQYLQIPPKKSEALDLDKLQKTTDEYKLTRPFFHEMVLVSSVNNFLTYLSDVLFEIFVNKPETLKSSKQVTCDDVLSHGNMSAFIEFIAKKTVHEVSYKSFKDICDFFSKRFKIKVCKDDDEMEHIAAIIEVRNLIVHNRSLVEKSHELVIKRFGFKANKSMEIDYDFNIEVLALFVKKIIKLDEKIFKKFF